MLDKLRLEIDEIDAKLLQIFEKRMAISGKIAQVKQGAGLEVLDSKREEEKLAQIVANAQGEFSLYVHSLYDSLFSLSRHYQDSLTQGKRGNNVILIGMPGGGKTVVGRAFAKLENRNFVDLDQEIEKKAGKDIPTIFKEAGEGAFRTLETQVLKETLEKQGQVIATGGGIVLQGENCLHLKMGGDIFFLKRPIEALARGGRPLSAGNLDQMYKIRKPFYEGLADFVIENEGTPTQVAMKMQEMLEEGK